MKALETEINKAGYVGVYLERIVPDEDGKFTNVMLVSFERIALTHLLSLQQ